VRHSPSAAWAAGRPCRAATSRRRPALPGATAAKRANICRGPKARLTLSVMAAEDVPADGPADRTGPEVPQAQEDRRAIWKLNNADMRMLYITFIGGLAANVGVVLVVGLGLAIVRRPHGSLAALLVIAAGTFGSLAAAIFMAWLAKKRLPLQQFRPVQQFLGAVFIVFFRVLVGLLSLLCAVIVIALVGYAAGVK
jgi:hypothetical protein